MTSDSIGKAQKGFRLLQLAGFWLPVLTLLLAAAGVLTAVRRRRALVVTALAVAAGAALLGLALWVFRALYLDGLPAGVSQPAAGAVFDTLVRFLRTTVRMVVTLGVIVALSAWLTGQGRAASRVLAAWTGGIGAVRDATGFAAGPTGEWVHRVKPWLNWTVVAVAAATLLAWDRPTPDARRHRLDRTGRAAGPCPGRVPGRPGTASRRRHRVTTTFCPAISPAAAWGVPGRTGRRSRPVGPGHGR
ncbi:hypothetical protein ACFVYG_36010 [Streptomyces sp. NPDC058256]|uniref:hypothetical protein n=1 Tax=Streptomyces sp. NPDC058256 TaxID=3346408 RepID=UPI0036E6A294